MIVWGSGRPKREFLHVDDLAEASLFILNLSSEEFKKYYSYAISH